jgi:hypothetical protein
MSTPDDQDSASNSAQGPREVAPIEVDMFKIVVVGTVLYAIAFVVLLPFRTSLGNAGHGRWPWVALSGVVLGLIGLVLTYRRARRLQKDDDQ